MKSYIYIYIYIYIYYYYFLVPLVGHLALWEPLPSVSHWVLLEQTGSLVFLRDDAGLRTSFLIGGFLCSPDPMDQDLREQAPLGKSEVHCITRCPSLLSALRRSVC